MAITFYVDAATDLVKLRMSTDNVAAVTVEVTRTMQGETKQVRAAPNIAVGTPSLWAAADTAIVYNVPITYSIVLRDAAGLPVENATGGPVTVVNNGAYLRDVVIPSSKMKIRIVGEDAGNVETQVRRELLRPLGRRAPVVISDVRTATTGSMTLLTISKAEENQLRKLLDSGRTMMLTGPADWAAWPVYMHIGTVTQARSGPRLSEDRLWGLEWDEIDPPPVGQFQPVAAKRWLDLQTADTQWIDVYLESWLDLLFPLTTTLLRAA